MKPFVAAALLIGSFVVTAASQTAQEGSFRPTDGFVPNSDTAVKIAEAVLIPVYGEATIKRERPLTATRKGNVWTVAGTLNCGAPQCLGGTAVVKISKTSGEILFMTHYK